MYDFKSLALALMAFLLLLAGASVSFGQTQEPRNPSPSGVPARVGKDL